MVRDGQRPRQPFRGGTTAGLVGLLLALLLGGVLPVAAQQRAMVKPRFQDDLVATVDEYPTDLAWLGNDLLIATIKGKLYRLPGALPGAAPEVLLDLGAVVGTGREQGMVGVVADPGFSRTKNRFVYVFYTRNEGGCSNQFRVPPPDPSKCFNRLSRFSVPPSGPIDPATEKPLVARIAVGIPNHNSGDLAFGPDGLLYVSTGDGGVDTPGGAAKAQALNNLHGKILRIRRDGSVPDDNPFARKNSVACAKRATATAPSGRRCGEIFAYGLRNPFRFAFDPNAAEPRFFINDVGESTWEEVNLGEAGANYGWPHREGPCAPGQTAGCKTPRRFERPVHAYQHATGCSSVTGGAVVPETSNWGKAYRGAYLYADWACGKMFSLQSRPNGKRFTASELALSQENALTAMLFEPRGNVLYYAAESDDQDRSQVRAIRRKG